MKFLDLTFPTPAENLACDEALLDWREEGGGEEILRFWESPETFVVVGYANKIEAEVNTAACEARNVPIFRRCSGGGTVLQGRGCLNYALILEISGNSALANITSANQYIMGRNRAATQSVAGDSRVIKVQGHTDLACAIARELSTHEESSAQPQGFGVRQSCGALEDRSTVESGAALRLPPHSKTQARADGTRTGETPVPLFRKFSGNSQRRRKHFLLFHGTFLLDFNLALVAEFLKFPSRQPNYRNGRSHGDFLMNLNLPPAVYKTAMQTHWQAEQPLQNPPLERISKLAREKYVTRSGI